MSAGPHLIVNARGLHARAAAKLVRVAEGYDAKVWLLKDGQRVIATSIMGLMLLAASKGTHVTLEAEGPAAQDAIEAVAALIKRGFDEA